MSFIRIIQLLRVQDQQIVDAILTEVTDKHLEDAKTLWEPILEGSGQDVDILSQPS